MRPGDTAEAHSGEAPMPKSGDAPMPQSGDAPVVQSGDGPVVQSGVAAAARSDGPASGTGEMLIYDADTDALLASQYRDPLLRHLSRVIVSLARRYAPPGEGAVLDVGCGVGRTSLALAAAGYQVTGVDPSERAVELATAAAAERGLSGRSHFEAGDATEGLPAAHQGRFRLVVCSEVLEHVARPASVVAYSGAALRTGGHGIFTTPHDMAQWTVMDAYAGHVTRFTTAEMRALLSSGARPPWRLLDLATEGFPFQRTVMWGYDALLRRRGGTHEFGTFGRSPLYGAYVAGMPLLLRLDHVFRHLCRGTTLVAVAERV